ncbi:hypothetical protein chiPu_0006986 [Chiloscyllium punctatum]|uniref:U1-type domain-containing protein n=1 Tax=Chiloscyllium punctatum TaxID=137246 RepID=A0A401SDT4_CHIPU|nr:hypothetical protein [Chiloscyllium punctatum]
MKRPLSPEQITEDVAMKSVDLCTYTSGKILSNEYLDYQLNIKKRKIGLALCEVCNIQLNSAEQAEVHYNGRSHLKRMKQVNGYTPVNSATSAIVTSASTVFLRRWVRCCSVSHYSYRAFATIMFMVHRNSGIRTTIDDSTRDMSESG